MIFSVRHFTSSGVFGWSHIIMWSLVSFRMTSTMILYNYFLTILVSVMIFSRVYDMAITVFHYVTTFMVCMSHWFFFYYIRLLPSWYFGIPFSFIESPISTSLCNYIGLFIVIFSFFRELLRRHHHLFSQTNPITYIIRDSADRC